MCDVADLYETANTAASKGCGCSYELYVQKLTREIDQTASRLALDQAAALQDYARQKGDYAPDADGSHLEGFCCHGIEYGCCPAGCDDAEEDDWDSENEEGRIALNRQIMAEIETEEEQARMAAIAARDARVLDRIGMIRRRVAA
ncbi:plasmid protein [Acetobacter senegalensis]|uniref:Plasmid protein n=2 Tax=Acetobacter TaxID=434 RepID=A0A252EIJ3_9PROT|nr:MULTISPECIES: plasmid protein [Acetobacter]ATJ92839.1 plasmid protein [Acetobacter tropicalis]MCG4274348.1 plasmid protein [Acetobacter senegalensis]OUL66063.1 plasmid protein [Acetobacter senegalensis]